MRNWRLVVFRFHLYGNLLFSEVIFEKVTVIEGKRLSIEWMLVILSAEQVIREAGTGNCDAGEPNT